MSNSRYVNYTKLSPNHTEKRNIINKILIYYMYGDNLSLINIGNEFYVPGNGSTNYAVNGKGGVGLYVEETYGSKTTNTGMVDKTSISIAVPAFSKLEANLTREMYDKLVELVTDICRRNNIPRLTYSDNGSLITYVSNVEMNDFRTQVKDITRQLEEDVNNALSNYETSVIIIPEAEIITPDTNEFKVKVIKDAEIKDGPGSRFATKTVIRDKGVYTISEIYDEWGKLKSGLGWINLNNTVRI